MPTHKFMLAIKNSTYSLLTGNLPAIRSSGPQANILHIMSPSLIAKLFKLIYGVDGNPSDATIGNNDTAYEYRT